MNPEDDLEGYEPLLHEEMVGIAATIVKMRPRFTEDMKWSMLEEGMAQDLATNPETNPLFLRSMMRTVRIERVEID